MLSCVDELLALQDQSEYFIFDCISILDLHDYGIFMAGEVKMDTATFRKLPVSAKPQSKTALAM